MPLWEEDENNVSARRNTVQTEHLIECRMLVGNEEMSLNHWIKQCSLIVFMVLMSALKYTTFFFYLNTLIWLLVSFH